MEGVSHVGRKRFKELWRNSKLSFREADGAFGFALRRKRTNFRNGHVALAKKNGFSAREFCQIAREMGFCLVNVQPNHRFYLA